MDVEAVRRQFPALGRRVNGQQAVFADNASTTLKSRPAIDAVLNYYLDICANVHRGVNVISKEAESLYEGTRETIAHFIGADPDEIVLVRNTTQGINLASHMANLRPLDEVITTLSEHHSNILPWADKARIFMAGLDSEGRIDPGSVARLITKRTRLVAFGHVSNVTGLVNPAKKIIEVAKKHGLLTLVDAAQSAPHMKLDVQKLGCDFLAFSGHKMTGPSGTGALYVRRELLNAAKPVEFGGGMVTHVTGSHYQLEGIPNRFEAGTPNIEGTIGLGAAIDFLQSVGMDAVHQYSLKLGEKLVRGLKSVPGLKVYPDCCHDHIGTVSFVLPGVDADDLARRLCDEYGIMVRSGLHCAEPLVSHLGEPATVRASLYFYNTFAEIGYIVRALKQIQQGP